MNFNKLWHGTYMEMLHQDNLLFTAKVLCIWLKEVHCSGVWRNDVHGFQLPRCQQVAPHFLMILLTQGDFAVLVTSGPETVSWQCLGRTHSTSGSLRFVPPIVMLRNMPHLFCPGPEAV